MRERQNNRASHPGVVQIPSDIDAWAVSDPLGVVGNLTCGYHVNMEYQGHIRDGVVVFDGETSLEEGTVVRVVPAEESEHSRPLRKLLKYAGKAKGLPPDAGRNHDHYLYGTPKREDQ